MAKILFFRFIYRYHHLFHALAMKVTFITTGLKPTPKIKKRKKNFYPMGYRHHCPRLRSRRGCRFHRRHRPSSQAGATAVEPSIGPSAAVASIRPSVATPGSEREMEHDGGCRVGMKNGTDIFRPYSRPNRLEGF
jgi:hypothetical protein